MKIFAVVYLWLHAGLAFQTDYADIPAGEASLAFVFDTTGSMSDDLVQAKKGATMILNTTLSLQNQPLYNYILVPFNDPDIGPVFETTDPIDFQTKLDNITVNGGDDCPEMCIGAIYKAIDVCLPYSYIYVFTDASAKDFNFTDSVLSLNQKKQSKVVFWLTGDCGDHEGEGRTAYDRIASLSSGQVFPVQKLQLEQVFEYVRKDIKTEKVNLMSTESKDDNSTLTLPVDSKLTEITISVSGKKPNITLTDPLGNRVTDMKRVLDIENALIVKVKHPTPGKLRMDISSEGPHTVRVTGQTSAEFVVGISPKYLVSVNGTEHMLLTGYSTYMYIIVYVNGTDLHPPAGFSRIELLNVNGTFIREYKLTKSTTEPNIYRTRSFVPPVGYFYVKIIGTDENGYQINRLMSAAITGLQPEKPTLSMPDVITTCMGSLTTISCEVESLVPFSVRWYRKDTNLGQQIFFSESSNATLEIPEVCKSDGGDYVCNATNSAGSEAMSTFLNVTSCQGKTVIEKCSCAPCPERKACKKSSCPPALQQKSNCSTTSGKNLKQTENCTSVSKYGIGGIIGAGIVFVVETSAILGFKMARKLKKRKTEQTYETKNSDVKAVAML